MARTPQREGLRFSRSGSPGIESLYRTHWVSPELSERKRERLAEQASRAPELVALAKFPNVAVKATGAPGYSAEAYPFPTMQTYLRQIYDAFGPHRMFWGTDITKMPCSWRQCVTMFTEELPWLSDEDKRLVMGDALCAWWGWDRAV